MKLHMDPDAKGTMQKQRRISLPLKDKFDEILNKWEKMDIIEDVGDGAAMLFSLRRKTEETSGQAWT